jgi:hypothetical protein
MNASDRFDLAAAARASQALAFIALRITTTTKKG